MDLELQASAPVAGGRTRRASHIAEKVRGTRLGESGNTLEIGASSSISYRTLRCRCQVMVTLMYCSSRPQSLLRSAAAALHGLNSPSGHWDRDGSNGALAPLVTLVSSFVIEPDFSFARSWQARDRRSGRHCMVRGSMDGHDRTHAVVWPFVTRVMVPSGRALLAALSARGSILVPRPAILRPTNDHPGIEIDAVPNRLRPDRSSFGCASGSCSLQMVPWARAVGRRGSRVTREPIPGIPHPRTGSRPKPSAPAARPIAASTLATRLTREATLPLALIRIHLLVVR